MLYNNIPSWANKHRVFIFFFVFFVSGTISSAQAIATQTSEIDIGKLTGNDSWLSQVVNLFNGTSNVLNAKPTVTVVVDQNGNHGVSSTPGNPLSVTITKNSTSTDVSFGPDGVAFSVSQTVSQMPDQFSWEITVDSAGRIKVTVEITENGQTSTYPYLPLQIRNHASGGGAGSSGGSSGGSNPSHIYIILTSIPNGTVTIGPITPIPPSGGAGQIGDR